MTDNYWLQKDSFTDWKLNKDALFMHFKESKQEVLLNKAIDLVKELHSEPRLDGVGTANVHLLRVPRILIEEMEETDIETVLIGLLHDVIEDTSYSEDSIEKDFGKRVLHGVKILSRPREKDWEEYAKGVVAQGNRSIIKVKIADKLDNARSLSMSDNETLRSHDLYKTTEIMKPIIDEYYPTIWLRFEEVLARWNKHR